MNKGDPITVTIAGVALEGEVHLASENGRSLAVLIDEGVPPPFGVYAEGGKQILLLFKQDDGTWVEIQGNRVVQVK